MNELSELETLIRDAMRQDQFRLRKRLQRIRHLQKQGKPYNDPLAQFRQQLADSVARHQRRRDRQPSIKFSSQLPINDYIDQIGAAITQHQVVVVCGETGSGKSTQLPKICLQQGLGIGALIGHTQPRRIAAQSIASRLAEELRSPLGEAVGYKIRFTDRTNPGTYIKLMTDGILLAETQSDRFLDQYDAIILDEAHERSLNIDFLVGYLKRLLPKRPDLRVIVTSATIDAQRFSEHFDGSEGPAPIVEVPGRTFPVEIRYRPLESDTGEEEEPRDMFDGISDAVSELVREGSGDLLVFLPTEQDIRLAAKRLRGDHLHQHESVEILPLYARLSSSQQNKVFQSSKRRRIVLATNVAESSLTVPGIRYVIDTGTARISRYAARSKVQRLPIEAISRASADQRAGRCGRVESGICIRLYSEQDYLARDAFTTPEIRRSNLAAVILTTQTLKLGPVNEFPFLDPPRPEAVRDGYKTLFELGAIDQHRELTKLGRSLSRLPVDPRIGRMILESAQQHCLCEMLIVAAALEIRDPRERPAERREAADQQHAQFADADSDFVSLLNLWDFFHGLKQRLSQSQLRKACQQNFLSYNRMREWQDIHRQLLALAHQTGLSVGSRKNDPAALHRSLLAGLLSGVAHQGEKHEYLGAGGTKFFLWPGSGVFANPPKWIVAAEVVETSRRYGRMIARISPQWIEPLAQHLIKCSFSDPHWHAKSGRCMAYEKVSLFGLTVVPRRRVPYGTRDPEKSRELLIECGLADCQWVSSTPFLIHNRRLEDQLKQQAAKTRNRDLIVDPQNVIQFYQQQLPADVIDVPTLLSHLKRQPAELNRQLSMTIEDLLPTCAEPIAAQAYPDQMPIGKMDLQLEYRFEPGAEDDGITVSVPAEGLHQLTDRQVGWLVPGMLENKITALIRSLPKSVRRNLVPAAEKARQVANQLDFGQGNLVDAVARHLSDLAQQPIRPADFRLEKLDPHLWMNVRVIDEDGQTVKMGRDLTELRQQLGGDDPGPWVEINEEQWTRDGIECWDLESFPPAVTIQRGGVSIQAFPTLIDQGQDVALRLSDSQSVARQRTQFGLMRLFARHQRKSIRSQVKWLPELATVKLLASPLIPADQLERQLADLIARRAFVDQQPWPTDLQQWQEAQQRSVEKISIATQDIAKLVPKLFQGYHRVAVALEDRTAASWQPVVEDVQHQVTALMIDPVLVHTPWEWLQQFPRYFQAIEHRLDKVTSIGFDRDQQLTAEIDSYWQKYAERHQQHQAERIVDPELTKFRWMIEEYRVSLYAQSLGTCLTVSAKRLEKQLAKVK